MAVIKDVAKLAGVSPSAVSKYLRTPQNMRADTRERIRAAIETLHYQPSQLAKSLRTGRSGMIAITIPEIDNPYFSDVFSFFQSLCSNNDLVPVMLRTNTPAELERTATVLNAGFLDGAICYDAGEAGKLFTDRTIRIPLVYMGPLTDSPVHQSVSVDLRTGMEALCRHLTARGARRIGYIGPYDDASSRQKFAAIRAYCDGGTLTLDESLIYPHCYGYDGGYESCTRMLNSGKALPDAIIAEADMIATGVLKCLIEHGVRVPDDILLSGYDNTAISQMTSPALTTIHIPALEMCAQALRMLLAQLNGESAADADSRILFQTQLIARASTGGPAG